MAPEVTSLSFKDFSAYDLPTKKSMKLFCPKMRLRLHVGKQNVVSTLVTAGNSGDRTGQTTAQPVSYTQWDDAFCPTALSHGLDERFELHVEKRKYLFWYTCIRRTRQVSIRHLKQGSNDNCTLTLHDGQVSGQHGQGITMGRITFTFTYETSEERSSGLSKSESNSLHSTPFQMKFQKHGSFFVLLPLHFEFRWAADVLDLTQMAIHSLLVDAYERRCRCKLHARAERSHMRNTLVRSARRLFVLAELDIHVDKPGLWETCSHIDAGIPRRPQFITKVDRVFETIADGPMRTAAYLS
ncbi:hypothetical protein BS17DRAFT_806378 [Gyrodon lividus]|nr:hypothetical protein BS17DRAFT_806378 [Gyrodon lividus]